MLVGTVKWFSTQKGFGYIVTEGYDKEVLVHMSALRRAGIAKLIEGQRVRFELERDRKTGRESASELRIEPD